MIFRRRLSLKKNRLHHVNYRCFVLNLCFNNLNLWPVQVFTHLRFFTFYEKWFWENLCKIVDTILRTEEIWSMFTLFTERQTCTLGERYSLIIHTVPI